MDLLGQSLHDVFRKNDREIQPALAIKYGKKMIQIILNLHKFCFVYRDIKPQNFVFSKDNPEDLKLVDFGLAKKISSANQKSKTKLTSKVIGTLRYASINAHQGKALGRKDDIESLVYLIIYLLKGRLPWQGLQCKNQSEKKDDLVYKRKKFITSQELCEDLPLGFQKLINFIRDEDFFDKNQNYDYIFKCLDESFEQINLNSEKEGQKDWFNINNQLDALKSVIDSITIQFQKSSSNSAENTQDQKEKKKEIQNEGSPLKKNPIKKPSIKKKFDINEDSDSQGQEENRKDIKEFNFKNDQ